MSNIPVLYSTSPTMKIHILQTTKRSPGWRYSGIIECDIGHQGTELRKHGSLGNKSPEPMSVFRNQVIRQGQNIQEPVKLLMDNSKKDSI